MDIYISGTVSVYSENGDSESSAFSVPTPIYDVYSHFYDAGWPIGVSTSEDGESIRVGFHGRSEKFPVVIVPKKVEADE